MTTRLLHDTSRLLLSVAVLLIGCEDPSLPTPGPNPPLATICDASVVIMVKSTDPPVFSWTPNCRVARFIVETASTGSDRWVISLAGGFNGPLSYGDAPPGAAIITAAQALVHGTDYRFLMFADLDEARFVGAGTFTR